MCAIQNNLRTLPSDNFSHVVESSVDQSFWEGFSLLFREKEGYVQSWGVDKIWLELKFYQSRVLARNLQRWGGIFCPCASDIDSCRCTWRHFGRLSGLLGIFVGVDKEIRVLNYTCRQILTIRAQESHTIIREWTIFEKAAGCQVLFVCPNGNIFTTDILPSD